MATKAQPEVLTIDGREVSISNPGKVLFPETGYTKLDLVRYYVAVADGALRGAGGRPNVLVRYPNGIGQEFSYQKRAPDSASMGSIGGVSTPQSYTPGLKTRPPRREAFPTGSGPVASCTTGTYA